LQELTDFEDVYQPALRGLGYQMEIERKSQDKDGQLVAYKADKFEIIDK